MAATVDSKKDFHWSVEQEPHHARRQAILKAHPEVAKLNGHEPLTKYVVFVVMALQFTAAYLLKDAPVFSVQFLLTAYALGGTCNQNIFLAIHEISHNLAFKSALANRMFAIFTNLPIGIPYSAAFRPYHLEHHKEMGVDMVDTDIPTRLEALLLHNVLGKAFFATFQVLFYALRPMMIKAQEFTWIHLLNLTVQLAFDAAVVHFFGYKPLVYFLMSSFLACSLHPCAGHFIAEHYVFQDENNKDAPPTETYSYYGSLNLVTYNVGYHNEHHDFPFIPWTRLPELRRIAPEFYDNLPQHKSWSWVIVQFITDPKVGMFSRVKRQAIANKKTN